MESFLTEDIIHPSLSREDEMQREMDLIRTLLLRIESDPQLDGTRQLTPDQPSDIGIIDHSYSEVAYHLNQLIDKGYVKGTHAMQMPSVSHLTWEGHNFVDSVRDPETWAKTKKAAVRAGGFTIEILRDIAIGLIVNHQETRYSTR
jgi:Hypothetical protein (DUF2513)